MPKVQIEGVGVVAFPDDFSPDQISSAIERDILPRMATGKPKNEPDVAKARKEIAEAENPVMSAVIGAGRVTDQAFKGIAQAFRGGWIPESMQPEGIKAGLEKMKGEEKENKVAYDALSEAHPVATTVGEIAGTLPFMVGATPGYMAAAKMGALPGLISYGDMKEKAIGTGAGVVGGVLGTAFGNTVAKLAVKRGAAPLADVERIELVRAAQELGIELRPDQITGKNWQRNLYAALRENPMTSGQMERLELRQQGQVDDAATRALEKAGGHIDQPSAGNAAREGLAKGVAKEDAAIDQGYRDVLQGVDVDMSGTRAPLTRILDEQGKLPGRSQGREAVDTLEELLGSRDYGKQGRMPFQKSGVNAERDDIIAAMRKLGGVDPSDEAVGSLAKANPFPPDPRLGPVWRQRTGRGSLSMEGHSLDTMAGFLRERGYPVDGPSELMDLIADAGMGKPTYSMAFDHAAAQAGEDPLVAGIRELTEHLRSRDAPQRPARGWLRDNPTVPGELAQDLRSGYRVDAENAFAKGKNQSGSAFTQMKGVIDDAIERAVPEVERGQFEAVNTRYGMGVAIKQLPKRDQQVLLEQIYRGFKSEDEFAAFVAMSPDKEFKDVARGFLSKIVDKARNTADGHVNAKRLGMETRGADKDAMRMLGQDAGDDLSRLGAIGEKILPELGNSQTTNRGFWMRVLQGAPLSAGGAALGGYGGGEGLDAGSLIGAGAGAILAPKAAAAAFLSPAMRGLLTRSMRSQPSNALGRALSPEMEQEAIQLLRALGGTASFAATE